MEVRRKKKKFYEQKILEIIKRFGPLTPYEVSKLILKEMEGNKVPSKRILRIYSIVLKAIKRLHKKEILADIEDKDSFGRNVKRYGLTFKGLLFSSSNSLEEIRRIIKLHWESLLHPKFLKFPKQEWLMKFLTHFEIQGFLKKETLEKEAEFILLFLLHCKEEDYKKLFYSIKVDDFYYSYVKNYVKNNLIVLHYFSFLFEILPTIPVESLMKMKEENEEILIENLKNFIMEKCLKISVEFRETKEIFSHLQNVILRLNLKEKDKWIDALSTITNINLDIASVELKYYGEIPKLVYSLSNQRNNLYKESKTNKPIRKN